MNKAEYAIREIRTMDELTSRDSLLHNADALLKLAVAVVYILTVMSFDKYDYSGLVIMLLFPVIGYQFSLIPVKTCFSKLRFILPLVCAVGIFNPLLDRNIVFMIGTVGISGGVISMITLLMKGIFSLMASFLLAATTTVDDLCAALRRVHVPKLFTSLFLLTFRYVTVMLEEVYNTTTAYSLRAPGQKGINFKSWGSLVGQILIRSMDRAGDIYESMILRGYNGEFSYCKGRKMRPAAVCSAVVCIALIVLCRAVNISELLTNMII